MLGALCFGTLPASLAEDIEVWYDPVDAAQRRIVPGAGPGPGAALPDMLEVRLSGWTSASASTNPYAGSVQEESPDLFRLDITFAGIVNPPGPIDPTNYQPFLFGPSPALGFFEFNVDREYHTGGEIGSAALHRVLANTGRFAELGEDSLSSQTPRWGDEIDGDFFTPPQFERSGADFALVLCGCFTPQVLSGDGNGNGRFDAGEAWMVRGRFWQRAEGFRLASFMQGGPQPGLWQPDVTLRWSHSTLTNRTTLTLVSAMTQSGAAQLAGSGQAQPMNYSYSAVDHTSMQEAISDLIDAASTLPLTGPTAQLAQGWAAGYGDSMDPTRWRLQAIVGTAYAHPQGASPYLWTDVGFEGPRGDLNYDGLVTQADRALVRAQITVWDGSTRDADGTVNGSVLLAGFGANFAAFDIDHSGAIDIGDSIYYCIADQDDNGVLNVADFTAYLQAFASLRPWADIDGNGLINVADFTSFLQRFAAGCPV